MYQKSTIHFNKLLLGLFFLIWATNAYVLLGNIGKYLSLCLGMYFFTKSILVTGISYSNLWLAIRATVVFLIMVFIAIEQNQETVTPTLLIFGLVCLSLFVLGNIFKTSVLIEEENNTFVIVLISTLILLSSIKLYRTQVLQAFEVSREIAEGELNAVGVAYTQGLLFLMVFWLYIREKAFQLKIVLIGTLLSILVLMVITGSRGALLYMSLTLLFFYRHLFRDLFQKKSLFILFAIYVSIVFFLKDNSFFNDRIALISDRFSSMVEHVDGNNTDNSLEERDELQSAFFEEYDEMFLGYRNYIPYPHNQFIEIFMRWGVFGVPIFFISILSFIRSIKFTLKKQRNVSSVNYLLVSIFFFCFLQSMTSLSLEMNRLMWFGFGFFIIDKVKPKLFVLNKSN